MMSRVIRVVLGLFFIYLLISGEASADCRGCCSRHGGVVCGEDGVQCADGSPLSARCQAKACNPCEGAISQGKRDDAVSSANTLAIANFNIQVFGVAKAGKPEVMKTLGKIITRFDIVAIQEIRDKSGRAIKALEREVDALGKDYTVITGPRLGRTSSKEQYAYIYRTEALEYIEAYTYEDEDDTFHRPPFIARFMARGGDFSFVLITVHTDPDEATEEIEALPKVVDSARNHFPREPHLIILGDLNADCAYYDERNKTGALRDESYRWLITNTMDTNLAASQCTYDRIIITAETTPYTTGHANIFRFDTEYGLSRAQAKRVSDHYPVFALFTLAPDAYRDDPDNGCYIQSTRCP